MDPAPTTQTDRPVTSSTDQYETSGTDCLFNANLPVAYFCRNCCCARDSLVDAAPDPGCSLRSCPDLGEQRVPAVAVSVPTDAAKPQARRRYRQKGGRTVTKRPYQGAGVQGGPQPQTRPVPRSGGSAAAPGSRPGWRCRPRWLSGTPGGAHRVVGPSRRVSSAWRWPTCARKVRRRRNEIRRRRRVPNGAGGSVRRSGQHHAWCEARPWRARRTCRRWAAHRPRARHPLWPGVAQGPASDLAERRRIGGTPV